MNSLELLNVLDVIKNEEVYTKRLEQIKEAQTKLDQTQHIVQTISKAAEILEKAREKEKKINTMFTELEANLKRVRADVDKEYQDKYARINQKEQSAKDHLDEAKKMLAEARELNETSQSKQAEMNKWYSGILQERTEMTELKEKLNSKFYRVKQIIEE